ncbi:hypothetical protein AM500_03180 [Bacillus sp. FJAT-18017]|uniref:DUF6544 family protein n=1 Tax=Bacillus sp. FJAT-18017 TaxID=1705566 RepID=UPI0006AF30F6|nr:DUF6544 family protein [Bacillus sp. FJAT-18017]ALC88912.1 hypothetical protein AM500_03180 [Bacillus sp. FJAT-18017]
MPKSILVTLIIILIILFLLLTILKIGRVMFEKDAQETAALLFKSAEVKNIKIIHEEDLKGLPFAVQNWLRNSKVIGKQQIKTVRLKQEGRMRIKKDGPWMHSRANQYFTVDKPGFVWIADVKMAPFVKLSGLDTYKNGKGKMDIKLLSIFPVVDSEGPEINSGTMMRYLAELMWFPSAALSPYIKWDAVDKNTAKATMEYKGSTVSGTFYFNEKGDVLRFLGKRYKDVNGKYILSDWGGENKEFKEFAGIRIPSKSVIIWYEEESDFQWFEFEIKDIEFNQPSLYK